MNVIKKPNNQTIKVLIDEKDLTNPEDSLKSGLLDVLMISEGHTILISIKSTENFSFHALTLILRFATSLRRKNIELSLNTNQNLIDQLLELGIGRLIQSLEVV